MTPRRKRLAAGMAAAAVAIAAAAALTPAPVTDLIICAAWAIVCIALTLAFLWALMLVIDFTVLPAIPRGWWKRPWCWLLGHIEGEDFEIRDGGFFDKCTRCERLAPSDDD